MILIISNKLKMNKAKLMSKKRSSSTEGKKPKDFTPTDNKEVSAYVPT